MCRPVKDRARERCANPRDLAIRLRTYARARRYEDYLDKQITPTDLYYLEDIELARQLVELG